jgi:hypothetical protein
MRRPANHSHACRNRARHASPLRTPPQIRRGDPCVALQITATHVETGRGMPRPLRRPRQIRRGDACVALRRQGARRKKARHASPRRCAYPLAIVLAEPEGKPSPWRASWHATVLPRASRRSYVPVKLSRLRRHPHACEEVRRFARVGEAVALRNRSTAAAFCRPFPTRHDNNHSTCVTVQR